MINIKETIYGFDKEPEDIELALRDMGETIVKIYYDEYPSCLSFSYKGTKISLDSGICRELDDDDYDIAEDFTRRTMSALEEEEGMNFTYKYIKPTNNEGFLKYLESRREAKVDRDSATPRSIEPWGTQAPQEEVIWDRFEEGRQSVINSLENALKKCSMSIQKGIIKYQNAEDASIKIYDIISMKKNHEYRINNLTLSMENGYKDSPEYIDTINMFRGIISSNKGSIYEMDKIMEDIQLNNWFY